MASKELNFLMDDVSKELAAVHDSLRRKHVEFIPVLLSERQKIIGDLAEMKESLNSRLDAIDMSVDEEEARSAIEEVANLRARSSCLRDCRDLLDKFSTIEASMEEMRLLLDNDTDKCAEVYVSASYVLPTLDDMQSVKGERTGELMSSITKILYRRLEDFRNMLQGKLHHWARQALAFPASRVASLNLMNVCMGDSGEACKNIKAMNKLDVFNEWLVKLCDNMMKTLIHPVINAAGFCFVTTGQDPMDDSIYTFKVRAKKDKRKGEVMVDEIFKQLLTIFTHFNAALHGVEASTGNSLAAAIMAVLMPQIQMAVLKNVISPRSKSESELAEVMKQAEAFREQLMELGLINGVTPSFQSYAETHAMVFTDRKCMTRLARARELILAPYVKTTTVGYGEEDSGDDQFDEDELLALGMRSTEGPEDASYPFFFRLLKCEISTSIKELVDLVRETVAEAGKATEEEVAGRLMLTARNMVEMFLLLTRSHATVLSGVPQQAALYHSNCHYIGHRLMIMVFDVVNEKNQVIMNSFRSFFAPFLVQLRASAQEVMNDQLLQIRRNISTMMADASMSEVGTIEKAAIACTMLLTSIANSWKEILPELVFCGAMANIIGFLFDQLSHLMFTVEDITSHDADFIATRLSTTLRQIEKLVVIRGSPMLHKECTEPYFHFKEVIFMLQASLQDIDDRWCDGVGPLAQWLSVKEIRHLVKALFAMSDQRKRLLARFY